MARILAVDDQLTIRELISAVLKPHGHTIDTAEDGLKALQLAKNNQYDLVITDVNMPNMNGIAFVGKARQIPHMKYAPMLILSTERDDAIKMTARKVGASGWLSKPFDSYRLSNAVKKLLAKAEQK